MIIPFFMNESDAYKPKEIPPIQFFKGVGPKRAEALAKSGICTLHDMLLYVPRSYVDRNSIKTLLEIAEARKKRTLFSPEDSTIDVDIDDIAISNRITAIVRVVGIRKHVTQSNKSLLFVQVRDSSPQIGELIFFNNISYYSKYFQNDELYIVSGEPDIDRNKKVVFTHPELDRVNQEEIEEYTTGKILPRYPMTKELRNARISTSLLKYLFAEAYSFFADSLPNPIPEYMRKELQLPKLSEAILYLHSPENTQQIAEARKRMKFEELFLFQIMLALRQRGIKSMEKAEQINPKSVHARKLLDSLPFSLTNAQIRALNDIAQDVNSSRPMNRLLQGDVGSGKTIVALFSMLMAIDSGFQSLLMAPTEVLAEQHFRNISLLLNPYNIKVVQVVGGQKKRLRNEIMAQIASGEAAVIVGTHALFGGSSKKEMPALVYHKLGLVVIDEQHRFGVMQRAKLKELARNSLSNTPTQENFSPHILVMSATPIPRTLSMTLYGDLDVSTINEMPKNRKPILTSIVYENTIASAYDFIKKEIQKGRQAYIVYPFVEQSEKIEGKSAVECHEYLSTEIFSEYKVGLLHGQMLWYEKDDAMTAFKKREFDVLVATTVVEVGVDVPNATVMLVENAHRFGLAQLHQLRGRVGRGADQSYCFLATKDYFRYHANKSIEELTTAQIAMKRLKTLEESSDGFYIAEVDMKLRGPGDVMGTRQSGLPEFRFADLVRDGEIVSLARTQAFALVNRDPHLRKKEHAELHQVFIERYGNGQGLFDVA